MKNIVPVILGIAAIFFGTATAIANANGWFVGRAHLGLKLYVLSAVLFVAALVIAIYNSRQELEQEKSRQSKPSIRARIQQVRVVHSLGSRLVGQLLDEIGRKVARKFEDQPVDVYVQLYLTNERINAPTTVRDYQLIITNGEKQVRGERLAHIEGETLEFEVEAVDGYGFTQTRRERKTLAPDLAFEINRTQIEYGKPTVGWLRFSCKGIKPEDVRLDSITLLVVDAFDTPHRAAAEPGAVLKSEIQDF